MSKFSNSLSAMPRIGSGAALLLAVAASPLAAACPTGPEDAARGVVLEYDDDSRTWLTAIGDDIVEERTIYNETSGVGYHMTLLHGFYEMSYESLQDGEPVERSQEVTSYPDGIDSLPAPEAGLQWQSDVTYDADGDEPVVRSIALSIGDPGEVSYGDCSYEALPVQISSEDSRVAFEIEVDYLPALGLSVMRSYSSLGKTDETYTPLSISVVED